jgi:hypothetical protein
MNSPPRCCSGQRLATRISAATANVVFGARNTTFNTGRYSAINQVERIGLLGGNAAADQIAHQDRNNRDRKSRGRGHRIGLGERERREQPSFLGFQREYGDERKRDDQQREEKRRTDFGGGIADDAPLYVAREPHIRMIIGFQFDGVSVGILVITTAASTMAPIAMAIPPSDMMFAFTPW